MKRAKDFLRVKHRSMTHDERCVCVWGGWGAHAHIRLDMSMCRHKTDINMLSLEMIGGLPS